MKAQSSKSTLWRGLWILSIQSKAEKEMRCRAWRGGSWATRPDTAPERCCCQLSKLWKRSLILPKKHKYFLKCITGQNWERNSTSNQPTKVRLSLDAVKIFCACLKAQTSACNSSGWSFGCHLEEVQSSPLLTVQTHDYWLPPMVFHPLSVVCDRDESVMGLSVQVLSHESPLPPGLSFTLTTLMWSAGTESCPRWHASQSNNKNLRFGPWPQPSVFCPLVWFPLLYSWFTENPLLVLFSPINVTDYCDWYLRRTTTRQIYEIYENVK